MVYFELCFACVCVNGSYSWLTKLHFLRHNTKVEVVLTFFSRLR